MVAPFYASHPASTVVVADYQVVGGASADHLTTFSSPLSRVVTDELLEAGSALGLETEELLLAALGGAIARTVGEGVVGVDVLSDADAVFPVSLRCENDHGDRATEILVAVHRAVVTASLLGAQGVRSGAEIAFTYCGNEVPGQRHMTPDHALELVAYHLDGLLELDWRYDSRRFERYTVEELSEQFALALIALTSEASPLIDGAVATQSRIFAAR